MKLNDSKTEFIMVGSKHNLLKTDAKNTAVQIGNDIIMCLDSVRDLGFIIENELKSTAHICTSLLVTFVYFSFLIRILLGTKLDSFAWVKVATV